MTYIKPSEQSDRWKLPLLAESINECIGNTTTGWNLEGEPTTEAEWKASFKMIKTPIVFNDDGSTKTEGVWRTEDEWGITWADIKAKWDAKIAAQPMKDLRGERNDKLAETDYWAAGDRTITEAQKKYRQDLRDLPANTSDPSNPTWPTKPGG